ncbi:DUF3265 domain-containing protein, partial [Vibrio vulnificus]|nr:DUF3265 domain-containing protein [Vibrio vulnificus]
GIWHAWHFRFALGSVIKVLCGSFCSACLHPLTRRYAFWEKICSFTKQMNIRHFAKTCIVSTNLR